MMCILRLPIISKYIESARTAGRAALSISFISHSPYVRFAISIHRQMKRYCLFMTRNKQNVSTDLWTVFLFS